MRLTYRYNLLALGFSPSNYESIRARAESISRNASAVDTGSFRKGWRATLTGDFLLVTNSVRYAPPVELGSIVYKKHQYKIRRALSSIGLRNGRVDIESGTATSFSAGSTATTTRTQREPEEDRSPAIRRRVLPTRTVPNLPKKADLFKRAFLLSLLTTTQGGQNEQSQEEP